MPKILRRPLRLNPSAGASERPRCCPRKSAGARLPRVSWAGTEHLSDEESYLLMWSIKVTAACHKRSTYVGQCVPHTWDSVFHLRGTVHSTYVGLCVSSMWNCAFHLRGTVCSTYVGRCSIYVEPSVPPIGTVSSIYWNCAFHILELCVPKHGTLLEHCECCGRGRHRACSAVRGASFVNED